MVYRFHLLVTFCCCILLCSCAASRSTPVTSVTTQPATAQPAEEEQKDLSCGYFNFLRGAHAEYREQYSEALKAYEKALTCDPAVEYIKEKIPVLLLKMGEFDKAADWLAQSIKEHPENNTYRLLLAGLYIQQEKVENAIPLYKEILKREPTNETAQLHLALVYSHLGKFQKAEQIFKKLSDKDSDSYITHLSYARLLKEMDKEQDAAREYEKALSLNWSKELAFEIGYFYANQEMFKDALRIYTTITENDPFDEQAALSRVQALLDLERNDEALKELNNIRLYTDNPANIDLIISKVLLRKKEPAKARKILTGLVRDNDNSEARYMLALLAYQDEDYESSLSHLAHIDSESDEFEEAVYLQTRIYQKLDRTDEAIIYLQKQISQEAGRNPLFYALLSTLYQLKGANEKALTLMEKASILFPDNSQLLFEYGLVLEKNGMSDKAVKIMQQVLELQPDHAEALNYIGYTWVEKNIHLEKALEYILKANTLKPNNGFIIDSLGWAYYRLGNLQQAVKELERSLELVPDDPHIYEHLGDIYRSLKRYSEAKEAYINAYEMFKNEKEKTAIKQKINALENR